MVVRVLGAAKHDRGQGACGGEGAWGGVARDCDWQSQDRRDMRRKKTAYRDKRDGIPPPQRSS